MSHRVGEVAKVLGVAEESMEEEISVCKSKNRNFLGNCCISHMVVQREHWMKDGGEGKESINKVWNG